jgi:hypothetical protein
MALSARTTSALAARAREQRTTVHGALAAALLTAIRADLPGDEPRTLQCSHPVNLRPLLHDICPTPARLAGLDERMGYLVSYVESVHALSRTTAAFDAEALWSLARDVSSSVRTGREQHVPVVALPLVSAITRRVASSRWPSLALALLERTLVHNALIVTNLGRVPVEETLPGGVIETLHFVAASSFVGPCIACVATYHDELRLNLCYQEPTLTRAWAERIVTRAQATLEQLAV